MIPDYNDEDPETHPTGALAGVFGDASYADIWAGLFLWCLLFGGGVAAIWTSTP